MEKKAKDAKLTPDEVERAGAIEGIRQGLADIEVGRHVSLDGFEKAMREKYNISHKPTHHDAERRLLKALALPECEITPEDWNELWENVLRTFPSTGTAESTLEAVAEIRKRRVWNWLGPDLTLCVLGEAR